MSKETYWRYTFIGLLWGAFGLFIIVQMVRIQVSPQAAVFRNQSLAFEGQWMMVTPARGQIYDRWGNLMAGNTTVYQVGVELAHVENPATVAWALSAVLGGGYDYDTLYGIASREPSEDSVYAVLADFVTEQQKEQIENFVKHIDPETSDGKAPSLAGVIFSPHLMRSYPEKSLASNILGFVSREGRGYFGVEEKFNDLLAGTQQRVWVPLNPNRVEEMSDVPPGASLILTIDRKMQSEVEEILDGALEETGSEYGVILVMDPETGEMMAMASTPRMDLNEYWRYGEIFTGSTPFNRAVSQAYEPGSVFKVLTMVSGIDSGEVKPKTSFLDTGVFEIGGIYINNWNGGAWGPQDMVGCMQHSLNVCLAWVASELGTNSFYEYMQKFGVGRLTGIDLAGEVPGRLKLPGDSDWYEADLGTNSFGQGVSTTPVQMLMAVSALANEGKMMTPRIVRSMIDKGRQYNTSAQVAGTPITAEAAATITDMLATSLESESSDALIEGYRVAGKTGTAEIPTPYGYSLSETNASFVGWGPVDDPKFLVYVWLHKPKTSQWGSVVAAPVFKEVVEHIVVLMNLPPDEVRNRLLDSQ